VKSRYASIEITSRNLPGIGVCQELELSGGRRIGIVTRRNGLRDLVIYDAEDADAAADHVELSDDEANAVAEILGAPQLTFRLAALHQQAAGLRVEQLPIPADSPFVGRPLGDAKVRTRTGASIVAILRMGAATPSPTPDFILRAGDLAVIVGTQDAIDTVAGILDGTTG
jgi:TrkA domain protein